jgi:hypothetical protein
LILFGHCQQITYDLDKQQVELLTGCGYNRSHLFPVHTHLLEFLQIETLILDSHPVISGRYLHEIFSNLLFPLHVLVENGVDLLQILVFLVQLHQLAYRVPVFLVVALLVELRVQLHVTSRFDEISLLPVDVTQFLDGVGLVRFQVDNFQIGLFCLVQLLQFLVAQSSHEMHLVKFGVFVDHYLQLVNRHLVLLLLDQFLHCR